MHAEPSAAQSPEDLLLWRALFERVGWGMAIADPSGTTILQANPAFARLYRATPAELAGQPLAELFVAAERPGLAAHLAAAGETYVFSARHQRRDGTDFAALVDLATIPDASGAPRWLALKVRDQTEHVAIIEARQRSEERYRTLAEATAESVWLTSFGGTTLVKPDWWMRFTGQTWEEMRGLGWLDVVHLEDQARVLAAWEQLLADHQPYQQTYRLWHASGEYRYVMIRAVPVLNDDGSIREVIGTYNDTHDRIRGQERLHLLADASIALTVSLDYHSTLQRFADLVVPRLADWCVVDQLVAQPDGVVVVEQLLIRGANRELEGLISELRRATPASSVNSPALLALLSAGRSLHQTAEIAERLAQASGQAALAELLQDRPPRALIVVPLVARGTTFGALSLATGESQRIFSAEDVVLVEELGRRVAQAIDNTLLYADLQRAMQRQSEALALLDTLFSAAPVGFGFWDTELRYVRVNAALAEMNNLPVAAHIGRPMQEVLPALLATVFESFREVMATGRPLLDQEVRGGSFDDPAGYRDFLVSYYPVILPDGAVVGLGSVVINITERKRAEEERAQLLAAEQSARTAAEAAQARLAFVAEVSATLASSLDYRTTLQRFVELAVPFLADWCVITGLEHDGALRELAWAHRDPAMLPVLAELFATYPLDAALPLGTPGVIRSGQPALVNALPPEHLAAEVRSPAHAALLARLQFRGYLAVPIMVRGATIGALTLLLGPGERRYGPADLALAEDVAHRVATAMDNARLYSEAQRALQLREEFLSLAAHELKTPITGLTGYAQLLQRRALRDPDALNPRDVRLITALVDQAARLSRLVGAMLDLSRLQSGQLTMERGTLDLAALAQRIVDETHPILEQHTLQLRAPATPVLIEGDELRLEQVLQNLIQNAIKYSPEGGLISVRIEPQAEHVLLTVTDQGIGIPSAALPQLFNRFYRAANVDAQHTPGMGLGLHVVKQLVELHHGTVVVESHEGAGSTFAVRLPWRQPSDERGAE